MSWYHVAGHQQDSVVCTCVRLSRNLTGYPFPAHLEAAGAKEIIGKVESVLEKNGFVFLREELGAEDDPYGCGMLVYRKEMA